jgi:hypothetical protein
MRLPLAAALVALMAAPAAPVAAATYQWTGYGVNVPGSSKCPTYRMTIDVTVDGKNVAAKFQQEGRPQRHFEATLDARGGFKTSAEVGGGGTIAVSGTISDKASTVLLDGYCKFGGPLTRR